MTRIAIPRFSGFLFAILIGSYFLMGPQVATASSIVVSTSSDGFIADGQCSLREAIQAANTDQAIDACSAGNGADTIVVPAGIYPITVGTPSNYLDEDSNATGDFDLLQSVAITGAGANATILDGGSISRLFDVPAGVVVELSGLTMRNGEAPSIGFNGGVVVNEGSLSIEDSVLSSSHAGIGGAIWNHEGLLTVERTSFLGNTASDGGAIMISLGQVTITNSTFNGNSAFNGGAIENQEGTLTLLNVTITDNQVNQTIGSGGGIVTCCLGTTTLKNSILAGNTPTECTGTAISAGYNIFQGNVACTITGLSTGNQYDTNPLLDVLTVSAVNGTLTRPPLPGSPAVDTASLDCPPPGTDGAGAGRPSGQRCDIGAHELRLAGVGGKIELHVASPASNRHTLLFGIIGSSLLAVTVILAVRIGYAKRRT